MGAGERELRDHLGRFLDFVRDDEEVTVTDHGRAVARLVPLSQPRLLDRLSAEGLVTPALTGERSRAGRALKTGGTVSDGVAEQRR